MEWKSDSIRSCQNGKGGENAAAAAAFRLKMRVFSKCQKGGALFTRSVVLWKRYVWTLGLPKGKKYDKSFFARPIF